MWFRQLCRRVRSRRASPARGYHLFLEPLERRVVPSFGIRLAAHRYTVDTGADVVFTVVQANANIISVKYQGNELMAPNSYSHYGSGLSSTATTITTAEDDVRGTAILAATDSSQGVTQYYIVHRGDNVIYMATYAGSLPSSPGGLRFLFYLDRSKFTVDPYSDISGSTAIEGSDVFRDPSTGYTYSKFYSAPRKIDDPYHGVYGFGVGAFMMIGSRENGSGGPFYKDINMQGTGAAEELYNVMYYADHQTEGFRPGLQGPYALEITNGSDPVALDYSFMDNLGISGWVPASGRGAIAGNAFGVPAGYTVAVALSNANAQYWTYADASGNYSIGGVLPGTYTETVYGNEMACGSQSVTISTGNTTPADIQATWVAPTPIWRIGTWDGTPLEFLSEPALNTEHPSDSRLAPWNNVTFVIGSNVDSDWPAAQWKDVNNDNQIVFNLTADQAAVANTLRIGITDAFANGRPWISVNTGTPYQWNSALPGISIQPGNRNITRGTYRGNNTTFTYDIPVSKLIPGTNTIDIFVNSGTAGSGFLSPTIVYDAIDLVPTSSLLAGSAAPSAPSGSGAATASFAPAFAPTQGPVIAPVADAPGSPARLSFPDQGVIGIEQPAAGVGGTLGFVERRIDLKTPALHDDLWDSAAGLVVDSTFADDAWLSV